MSHWACGIWLYSALTGCPEYTPYSTCVETEQHRHHHDSVPDSNHDHHKHKPHHPSVPEPRERPNFDSDYQLQPQDRRPGGAEFE